LNSFNHSVAAAEFSDKVPNFSNKNTTRNSLNFAWNRMPTDL